MFKSFYYNDSVMVVAPWVIGKSGVKRTRLQNRNAEMQSRKDMIHCKHLYLHVSNQMPAVIRNTILLDSKLKSPPPHFVWTTLAVFFLHILHAHEVEAKKIHQRNLKVSPGHNECPKKCNMLIYIISLFQVGSEYNSFFWLISLQW